MICYRNDNFNSHQSLNHHQKRQETVPLLLPSSKVEFGMHVSEMCSEFDKHLKKCNSINK